MAPQVARSPQAGASLSLSVARRAMPMMSMAYDNQSGPRTQACGGVA
jgi:hypothetical protein